VALYLSGCTAVGDLGSSLKYNMQGEYYLYKENFNQGRATFKQAVQTDPNNPEAQYYYGRFLLADNDARKALVYLKQATVLETGKSEYYFWLGVAYGESGHESLERKSYTKALGIDPDNIQALTYMGNNHLRAHKYQKALEYYRMALDLSYENPQALYNRAVALKKMGRFREEKAALLDYINIYPAGSFSRLAADRLNILGDHTYRNHRLGFRTVTLAEIVFVPSSAKLSETAYPSLDLVGESVANMPHGTLHIIVYSLKNKELAKQRAVSIRTYLARRFPDLEKNKRIQMSWFATAEKRVVLDKTLHITDSVQFFLTDFKK
jgi:tetratricopeptide (TPR) repeat protein